MTQRDALKALVCLNVDHQFAQKIGAEVFNPGVEPGDHFQDACQTLRQVFADMLVEIDTLQKMIPLQESST